MDERELLSSIGVGTIVEDYRKECLRRGSKIDLDYRDSGEVIVWLFEAGATVNLTREFCERVLEGFAEQEEEEEEVPAGSQDRLEEGELLEYLRCLKSAQLFNVEATEDEGWKMWWSGRIDLLDCLIQCLEVRDGSE